MGKGDLDDIERMLQAAAPDLPPDRIRSMAMNLQSDLGGSRLYIRKAPAEQKARALGDALATGASLSEAFEAAGCKHSQGYVLLARRWRR